jgi:hypothetical protein
MAVLVTETATVLAGEAHQSGMLGRWRDNKNQQKAAAAPQRQQWQPTVEDEAVAAVLETEVE